MEIIICKYCKIKYFNYYSINNEIQRQTKIIVDHFYDLKYLKVIYEMDFFMLQSQVKLNILGSLFVLIVFSVTLVVTFSFLGNKALSLIPLCSLFIISISIVILIINVMRNKVIKKIISGEYKIDIKFLKLLILKVIYDKEEHILKNKREKLFSLNNTCIEEKFLTKQNSFLQSPTPTVINPLNPDESKLNSINK
jgi:hypothetical protein